MVSNYCKGKNFGKVWVTKLVSWKGLKFEEDEEDKADAKDVKYWICYLQEVVCVVCRKDRYAP